jgi:ribosome-binding protein aMBF1 (putative translation factor)
MENIISMYCEYGHNNFMSRPTSAVLPRVERLLAELGENIRLARRRRGLSAVLVAERAGMSRPTLRAIERGDVGVTLGAVANVLHSLGLEQDLAQVARVDERGRELQDAALGPRRSKRPKPAGPHGP